MNVQCPNCLYSNIVQNIPNNGWRIVTCSSCGKDCKYNLSASTEEVKQDMHLPPTTNWKALNRPMALTGADVFEMPEFHALMSRIGVNSQLATEFLSISIDGTGNPVVVEHRFHAVGQAPPPPKMEFGPETLKRGGG